MTNMVVMVFGLSALIVLGGYVAYELLYAERGWSAAPAWVRAVLVVAALVCVTAGGLLSGLLARS